MRQSKTDSEPTATVATFHALVRENIRYRAVLVRLRDYRAFEPAYSDVRAIAEVGLGPERNDT